MSVLSASRSGTPDRSSRPRWRVERPRNLADSTALWAVLIFLLSLPLALALPDVTDLAPYTSRGSTPPLLAGIALLAAGVLLARRSQRGWLAGAAAGAFAGWVVLAMHTGLHGSPYGFNGILGDAGRLSAQAERYTVTWHSADGIVGGVPTDYPPLFPWLIGRASMLAGVPAWQQIGISETLLMALTVLSAFLLWRRLVPDWVAFAVTLAVLATFIEPSKAYEVMALDVTVPWALASFADPPRGRLGWFSSGMIAGLGLLLYQAYLVFVIPGIAVLIILAWRHAPARGRYAARICGIALTALLVGSYYWVPYVSWALTHRLQNLALHHQGVALTVNPFPFLALTPFGALTAVGLLGLVWYLRRAWWAAPLLILTAGVYAYRLGAEAIDVHSGSTMLAVYSPRAVGALLSAAGVLTVARAGPALARRLPSAPPAGFGVLAVAVLALFTCTAAWYDWVLGKPTVQNQAFDLEVTTGFDQAERAFQQWLPSGRYPRFAPIAGRIPWLPVDRIILEVRSVLGPRASPVMLSWNESIFAVQPWPGYIGVDAEASASTSEWLDRFAALETLSRIKKPAAFAHAAAHTAFGPITVFLLRKRGAYWNWRARDHPGNLNFTPAQFRSTAFQVFPNLPDRTVLAIRRGA